MSGAANATVANNVIGSAATANSLYAVNASTSGNAQNVIGIISSGNGVAALTGNTIVNLNNNATGSIGASQTAGILAGSSGVGHERHRTKPDLQHHVCEHRRSRHQRHPFGWRHRHLSEQHGSSGD